MVDQSLMTGESEPVRKAARDEPGDGPDRPAASIAARRSSTASAICSSPKSAMPPTSARSPAASPRRPARKRKKPRAPGNRGTSRQAEADDLEGTDAAAAKADQSRRSDQPGRLRRRDPHFPRPARTRNLHGRDLHARRPGSDALNVFSELLGYFVTMVIIIVVAVPEGLPMSVTVSLGAGDAEDDPRQLAGPPARRLRDHRLGNRHLLRQDRHADAEQDAGRSPVVGRVRLRPRHRAVAARHPRSTAGRAAIGRSTGSLSTPRSTRPPTLEEKEGKTVVIGNNTEGALLQWLRESGIEYGELRLQFQRLYQILFSSERKRMTTVIHYGDRLVALSRARRNGCSRAANTSWARTAASRR